MENPNKREKLTSGKCSLCDCPAEIPWKNDKFCYQCWAMLRKHIKEATIDQKTTQATEEETATVEETKTGVRRTRTWFSRRI